MDKLFIGDARAELRKLAASGLVVQCVVTSPPYWGLRDYEHEKQLGREQTVREYVTNLVETLEAAKGVLSDDGVVFLNIGDSYSGSGKGPPGKTSKLGAVVTRQAAGSLGSGKPTRAEGCKDKDLVGVPWRVAFALRDAGWWLRQEIIWSKPNAMPESVADRFSRGHEHVFMLTRSKRYYFNSDAASEVSADGRGTRRIKDVWNIPTTPYKGHHIAAFPPALAERCIAAASREGDIVLDMFMGSGTVAQAAHLLGRRWVGIDINPSSRKLVADRLREVHK